MRHLIINADDFGRTYRLNAGVIRAREHGIVTSVSLMVRWPAAVAAAGYAMADPRLGVGLHLDLGEWTFRGGRWEPVYEVVDLEDPVAVEVETERQLASFRRLLGREPTHLDSHQHVHLREPVAAVARRLADQLGIPLRHGAGIRYCGDFYGQTGTGEPLRDAISVDGLIAILRGLEPGITELACHPGEPDEAGAPYRDERRTEVQTLCDARVRRAIEREGIELCSFADVRRRLEGPTAPGH